MEAMQASGLRVVRDKNEILHNIDLNVKSGCVNGLIGPSGSGKTTLMRSIVGALILASLTLRRRTK